MLAPGGDSTDGARVTRPSRAIHSPADNPYRKLSRRRFSEPLLLLLLFLFGVWLWDNHLGSPRVPHLAGDPVQTWELTMRKADRDLRLAEGTRHLPPFVQSLLGIDPLSQTLDRQIESFELLVRSRHRHDEDEATREIGDEGAFALGVMIALQGDGNAAAAPFAQLGLAAPPPPEEVISRIIHGREHWWDMAYLEALDIPENDYAGKLVDSRTRHLVGNAIKSRGVVLALGLGGLIFIPGTLLAFFRAGRTREPVNYSHRWHLSFGLGVFLLAYLAFVGFGNLYSQGLGLVATGQDPVMSPPVYLTVATVSMFLPALIALGLMFRRPRHAISRLGLAGPFDGRMVLGSFAILQIIEFGLRMTIDASGPIDPTGGLSPEESGPWGLAFGIATACLAAPVAEEIVYRGVLFRSLANRLKIWPAVAISSIVFSLVHFYTWPSLIMVAMVGAACALAYVSSRALLTAIVLHALYNAAIKIPEWIVYQTPLS
ncbi:lysostaphin resistance A-like protein [Haloferula sp. A504]|uniref:lysostaphin resistance A-like protein n=1 Tax=Haloferula sp. A504 TaxID=3373601 RepID=UPI0031C351BB|nr:CPBP family intramembrane metalloprotease [Verrucomicrobiaceae bacterium E54]